MDLADLFDPRGIAVVGASRTPGKLGHDAMGNAVAFDGPVYPVNPSGDGTLFGEPFVPSVGAIDGPVDLALVCVPAPVVPDVLAACGAAGIGAAVVYSGGFAEDDEPGADRQSTVAEIASAHDMAVLGPNTSGFIVPSRKLFGSFVGEVDRIESGHVAILAQSGGVAHAIAFQCQAAGKGLSAMVGLGNRVNVGFEATIDYFDQHDLTDAIVLHLEGTDDARGLFETCRSAATPIVAYNVGRTDVDGFAASHTGALTGEWDLYEAGFAQYGVPTVRSTTALLNGGHALAKGPQPAGPNVGLITVQAGPGIIAADRLNDAGVPIPDLAPETRDRLTDLLDGLTYAANPVDTGRPTPAFEDVIDAVATDPNVDILFLYQLYEASVGYPVTALERVVDRVGIPVVLATDGPAPDIADDRARLEAAGVTTFRTPERGADAVITLVEHGRRRAAIEGEPVDG